MLFGLEFDINRVAFTLPFGKGWDIYWYGILISIGFLLALIYCLKRAKVFDIDTDRLIDVVLVATPAAMLGARAYYMFFDSSSTFGIKDLFSLTGLKEFFSIHNGGLAIYGGVIAAFIAAAIMCKIRKLNILSVFDLAAIGFLIGQAIGRWGNFFNQEAFGSFISGNSRLPSWWGMSSEAVTKYYFEGVRVHPCFFYESVWCIIGFVLLHNLSNHRKFKGQIFLSYGIFYGVGRFFIEALRVDSLYIGNFKVSQVVSLISVIVCSILYVIGLTRSRKKEIPTDYTPQFESELSDMGKNITDENLELTEEGSLDGLDEGQNTEKTDATDNSHKNDENELPEQDLNNN